MYPKLKFVAPLAVLLLLLGVLLSRPAWLMNRFYTSAPISAVKISPAYYKNGPVTIAGKVIAYQNHFGVAAYKVADKTGDILVFYDDAAAGGPTVGSYVITRGTLEEIKLSEVKTGVFVREQKRLFSSGGENKINMENNRL